MATWRFYQGLRSEWRWYRFDDKGAVIAESDQGFAELPACMANAETAGFTGEAYQVHARQGGENGKPGSTRTEPKQSALTARSSDSDTPRMSRPADSFAGRRGPRRS